jgi:hypothetical protein
MLGVKNSVELREVAVDHAATILALLREALSKASIRDTHEAKVAAFLAATIHDAFEAITILCGSAAESQVPLLARALLEAHVDLQNVCGDPQFSIHLHLASELAAKKLWNSVLTIIPDSNESREHLQEARNHVQYADKTILELKAERAKRMQVAEKFATPHVDPGTYWLYTLLCSPAHNDLNSLLDRFGDEGQVKLRARLSDASYFAALSISATAVLNTIILIPAYTDLTVAEVGAIRQPGLSPLAAINTAQAECY